MAGHRPSSFLRFSGPRRSLGHGDMILTLTSPTDINLPTTSALVLVTKDSFVSLVTNLNNKNNVCEQ